MPRKLSAKSHQPLAGMRVLITRAAGQAKSLAALLQRRGATVISVPVIQIVPPESFAPLDAALRHLDAFDWLILTSVNGVGAFFTRLKKLSMTVNELRPLQIAAIGPATRAAIERRGLRVAVMPRRYVAEAVVRALHKRVRGKHILLVRAAEARDVIPRELRRAGAKVNVVTAYETVMPAGSARRLRSIFRTVPPDVVTFTSSSSVRNFLRALPRSAHEDLSRMALASIGPVTTETLRQHILAPSIEANEYTMQGLTNAIARWAAKRKNI